MGRQSVIVDTNSTRIALILYFGHAFLGPLHCEESPEQVGPKLVPMIAGELGRNDIPYDVVKTYKDVRARVTRTAWWDFNPCFCNQNGNEPIPVDEEEFKYSNKCKHCEHQWSEG